MSSTALSSYQAVKGLPKVRLRGGLWCLISLLLVASSTRSGELAWADPGRPTVIERLELLDTFFQSLSRRQRGEGLVRITHVGDSHIIADFWTGEMREKMQRLFGDGGRGFVLGGKMWRSYGQRHISHKSEGAWEVTNLKRGRDMGVFGPGGAALICSDSSCTTQIETRSGQRASRFDQLKIYTFGNSQGGDFTVTVDQKYQSNFSTFTPWLRVQEHHVPLSLGAHQVSLSPVSSEREVWLLGFSLMNSEGGLIYDSIGLNGAQAKHLLKNSDENLRRAFSLLDPQLLVISFGINELFDRGYNATEYRRDLNAVLSALRRSAADSSPSSIDQSACLLTGPFTALRGGREPPELQEVYQIQRELSEKYRCALWDARAAMGGDLRPWQRAKLARRDGVHLSRHGYRRIAELFTESILMSWEIWRSQRAERSARRVTPQRR